MKLCVRVPLNGRTSRELTRWLMGLARKMPTADIDLTYTYGYGIAEGRNLVTEEFLATDCTHLWMIDSDVEPPPHLRILELIEEHPVVAAPYRTFKDGFILWHVYRPGRKIGDWQLYECLPRDQWPKGRPFHAPVAGGGCMIVQRKVFEKLGPAPWKFKRARINGQYRLSGEDFDFCERLGGVMIDPEYICEHEREISLNALKGMQR